MGEITERERERGGERKIKWGHVDDGKMMREMRGAKGASSKAEPDPSGDKYIGHN